MQEKNRKQQKKRLNLFRCYTLYSRDSFLLTVPITTPKAYCYNCCRRPSRMGELIISGGFIVYFLSNGKYGIFTRRVFSDSRGNPKILNYTLYSLGVLFKYGCTVFCYVQACFFIAELLQAFGLSAVVNNPNHECFPR